MSVKHSLTAQQLFAHICLCPNTLLTQIPGIQSCASAPSMAMVGLLSTCISYTAYLYNAVLHVGGMLPKCLHCQQDASAVKCCHCVPPMPDTPDHICTTCCTAGWDVGDPVTKGWVIEPDAILVSLNTSEHVTVYYRPCSDR